MGASPHQRRQPPQAALGQSQSTVIHLSQQKILLSTLVRGIQPNHSIQRNLLPSLFRGRGPADLASEWLNKQLKM